MSKPTDSEETILIDLLRRICTTDFTEIKGNTLLIDNRIILDGWEVDALIGLLGEDV